MHCSKALPQVVLFGLCTVQMQHFQFYIHDLCRARLSKQTLKSSTHISGVLKFPVPKSSARFTETPLDLQISTEET